MSARAEFVNRTTYHPEWRNRIVDAALAAPEPEPDALALVKRHPSLSSLEQMVLLTTAPSVEALLTISHGKLEKLIGRMLRGRAWQPRDLLREARYDREWMESREGDLLWMGNPRYPRRLLRLFDPPAMLYTWGSVNALHRSTPGIAMVGTRRPDDNGRRGAFTLGGEAARYGFPVVSGLALGIDAAAHRGVVATGRGEQAVAVLGSGIDSVYPLRNREFAGAILDAGGVLVSEYPPGTPPRRYQFPARNRIIAGLSEAVVLFQAPEASGALITVDHGLDIGLTILVHLSGAGWTGVKSLTDHDVICVETMDHVVRVLKDDAILPPEWRAPPEEAIRGDYDYDSERLSMFGSVESPRSVDEWRRELQVTGGIE
jgi:DNA processing protein